ncbi:MAG: deaminase [Mucilaginibacter sp.]|nr:deaminase [Mucilaginibacter sp.]
MRKLKLQIQTSLDGFVAGPNGEGDWLFLSGKNDPEALQQVIAFNVELASSSDTLLMGRKMAGPGFFKHWENVAHNLPDNPWHQMAQLIVNLRKIAFSRSEINLSGRNLEVEKRRLGYCGTDAERTTGQGYPGLWRCRFRKFAHQPQPY